MKSSSSPLFPHNYPHQLGALLSLVSSLKTTHVTGLLIIGSSGDKVNRQQVFGKSRESAFNNEYEYITY